MTTFTNTLDRHARSARLATMARQRRWVFKLVAAVFIGAGLYTAAVCVPALRPLMLPVSLVALVILVLINPESEFDSAGIPSWKNERFVDESSEPDITGFDESNLVEHSDGMDHSWGFYSYTTIE